ncbi:protein phosphatase 2C domain-containing protein [Actinomadura sp. 9N215]|uniref:protein phosphatase 2C domain-containing protein n=1 Tax=Actinomadura sp. 9N215 TaxID=3375150 RepID=UPI00379C331D
MSSDRPVPERPEDEDWRHRARPAGRREPPPVLNGPPQHWGEIPAQPEGAQPAQPAPPMQPAQPPPPVQPAPPVQPPPPVQGAPSVRLAPAAPHLPGEPFESPPEYRRPHPKGGVPRGLPRASAAVPDMVLDGADFDHLAVRAASLRGDEHRYYGEPRQDSVALWPMTLAGGDALLACVADGVGSQPNSHEGSALACALLREEIERSSARWTWEHLDVFAATARWIADAMVHHAERRNVPAKALSTTLVAAAVDLAPADGRHRFALLRLGDSTAFLLRDGVLGEIGPAGPSDGAILDTATDALPGDPRAVRTEVGEIGAGDVLVLCTDGLSNPMRSDEVREQLQGCWSRPDVPGVLEFGWQLGFRAKSFGDDRSAVCVWGR